MSKRFWKVAGVELLVNVLAHFVTSDLIAVILGLISIVILVYAYQQDDTEEPQSPIADNFGGSIKTYSYGGSSESLGKSEAAKIKKN